MTCREIRCRRCAKLLARGAAAYLEIRCPRCKTDNILRAQSPDPRTQPLLGDCHASECRTCPLSGNPGR